MSRINDSHYYSTKLMAKNNCYNAPFLVSPIHLRDLERIHIHLEPEPDKTGAEMALAFKLAHAFLAKGTDKLTWAVLDNEISNDLRIAMDECVLVGLPKGIHIRTKE